MLDIVLPFDDKDLLQIGFELDALYKCHDRKLDVDTKAEMVMQIAKSGIPIAFIVAGMTSMKADDRRRLTVASILSAAREAESESKKHEELRWCGECRGRGRIVMRNDKGYDFALACRCDHGNAFRGQGMRTWEGGDTQESRHGQLRKIS